MDEKLNNVIEKTQCMSNSKFELITFSILVPLLSVLSIVICLLPEYLGVPELVVFLLNIILTIIIAGFVHELIHANKSNYMWNYLLRINLHIYTPFTLGFNDIRKIHLAHHRHTNGSKDPDYPCVKGGKIRSFISLAFLPEVQFFGAIKHGMWDRESWITYPIRMIILISYIALIGLENYLLLYLLATKVAYSISFYLFSYEAHTNNDGDRVDVVNLVGPFPLLSKLLIGPYAYNIAHCHAAHHAFPWVSGRKLNLLDENWASKNSVNKEAVNFVKRKVFY